MIVKSFYWDNFILLIMQSWNTFFWELVQSTIITEYPVFGSRLTRTDDTNLIVPENTDVFLLEESDNKGVGKKNKMIINPLDVKLFFAKLL